MNDEKIDLTNCDKEPIHIPGAIQPHGVLVILHEPDLVITQISENAAAHFGADARTLLGKSLGELMTAADLQNLINKILPQSLEANPIYVSPVEIGEKYFELIAHRFGGHLILEFERQTDEARDYSGGTYAQLRRRINELNRAATLKEFCGLAADAVRDFTGFDRVMVYRFLDDGSGRVIAEAKRDDLESFLELHYPAADIPQQARMLYLLNPIRIKSDVDGVRVPLLKLADSPDEPLDMSHTTIRAMSPIHIEYLRNMGVRASMSLSIVKDGALWGLFACHHYTPRYVPHAARMATEFLAHLLSLQTDAKETAENYEYAARLKNAEQQLIASASDGNDFVGGLFTPEINLLSEIEADGAAIVLGDEIKIIGDTPDESQIQALAAWLFANHDAEVYASDQLPLVYPPFEVCRDSASGVLAARLTKHKPEYLFWFRGEHAHTVNWAGEPTKQMTVGEHGDRLTPRKSFALWRESVAGKSKSWLECEREHAATLRRSLVEIIIRQSEELAAINRELMRSNVELDSFAYVASHDLKEPLRGIHNYSHFLLEDYGEKLDTDGKEQLQTLVRLTERMENLLDSLLHYSRLGRAELILREVDLNRVLADSLAMLKGRIEETGAKITISRPLPTVRADESSVGEVFVNLIANALKYNDKPDKRVEIGCTENAAAPMDFYVRDNGIGIEERHHENIFRIFKRLHGRDEFGGGVGAGLTIAKKIVERHGGKIRLESEPKTGTTFYFTLE